jgi:hypothetical protein
MENGEEEWKLDSIDIPLSMMMPAKTVGLNSKKLELGPNSSYMHHHGKRYVNTV